MTVEALLKAADIALYEAKIGGRGRSIRFEASMEDRVQKRLSLEALIKKAVAENGFAVFYQPLLDLHSNKLRGFEALLRLWMTKDSRSRP